MTSILLVLLGFTALIVALALVPTIRNDGLGTRPAPRSHPDDLDAWRRWG